MPKRESTSYLFDHDPQEIEFARELCLAAQTALLGEISAAVRAVTLGWTDDQIHLRVIVDGEPTENDRESMQCVGAELIARFPEYRDNVDVIRLDAPQPLASLLLNVLIYERKEPQHGAAEGMKELEWRARICWLAVDEQGNLETAVDPEMPIPAHFGCLKKQWADTGLTMVCVDPAPLDPEGIMVTRIRMNVAASTTKDILPPGSRFELYDGKQWLAHGRILRDTGS